ncbi:MAG: mannosyltransferase family protein [Acidobacteriota bacterium]
MAYKLTATPRIVVFALGVRIASALLAFLSNIVFPLAQREPFTMLGRTHPFWDTFTRYDSGWYFGIARYGYEFVEGGRSNLAFFPLYPMLMRYLGLALGGGRENVYRAGIIVSWVSFVVAMVLLYRLTRTYVSDDEAERTVAFAAVFPFAFFFGVVYTEALFLMLSLAAFLGFRTGRWWLGGIAGACATATRVNGILMLPALAWLAWTTAGRDRARLWRAGVGLAMVPLGIGVYSLFNYSLSGNPAEWMDSIRRWNYHPGGAPWSPIVTLLAGMATEPLSYLTTGTQAPYDLANGGAAIVAIIAIPFVWIRFGGPYALLMIANLWLPLSSGTFEGVGRYCAVLFPLGMCASTIASPTTRHGLLALSGALYALALAMFTNIHPIF